MSQCKHESSEGDVVYYCISEKFHADGHSYDRESGRDFAPTPRLRGPGRWSQERLRKHWQKKVQS